MEDPMQSKTEELFECNQGILDQVSGDDESQALVISSLYLSG